MRRGAVTSSPKLRHEPTIYGRMKLGPSTSRSLFNVSSLSILPHSRSTAHASPNLSRNISSKPKSNKSKSASSSRYMARHLRDPFVKARQSASESAYLSRSAFKLIQLDEKYKLLKFKGSKTSKSNPTSRDGERLRVIVELGAAPGGWSQVLAERTRNKFETSSKRPAKGEEEEKEGETRDRKGSNGKKKTFIFALDILEMSGIEGIEVLKADFLEAETRERLRERIEEVKRGDEDRLGSESNEEDHQGSSRSGTSGSATGKERLVDLVLSDMMTNTSGNSTQDTTNSLSLCQSAYSFAERNLKQGGTFVCKYFESHEAGEFRRTVLQSKNKSKNESESKEDDEGEEGGFDEVMSFKPEGSRKESREMYWVCKGFRGGGEK